MQRAPTPSKMRAPFCSFTENGARTPGGVRVRLCPARSLEYAGAPPPVEGRERPEPPLAGAKWSWVRNESEPGPPRIAREHVSAGPLEGVAGSLEALARRLDIIPREHDLPVQQTGIALLCARCAGRPGVRSEMMMISACRQEQGAGIVPDRLVEAEAGVIELRRRGDLGHVQMYVAEHGSVRGPCPRLARRARHDAARIERFGRHDELPAFMAPEAPRPIAVHFDPQAVRIGQVDRLADEVV